MTDQNNGYSEAFLRANANPDFISHEFADVLRYLIRAWTSQNPTSATYRAAERMDFVTALLAQTEHKMNFYQLFSMALNHMRDDRIHSGIESEVHSTALAGVKMLVEESCQDTAARGRAANRRNNFMDGIKYVEAARLAARTR
jgi:hypothetical protein